MSLKGGWIIVRWRALDGRDRAFTNGDVDGILTPPIGNARDHPHRRSVDYRRPLRFAWLLDCPILAGLAKRWKCLFRQGISIIITPGERTKRDDMNRRACLAALGMVAVSPLSGCLGESTDRRPELAIEKDGAEDDSGCIEDELLDFERAILAPKLASLVGFESGVQWEVDLEAGEELYIRITNPDMHFLPDFTVVDPEGTAIIDERPVDSIYTIEPQINGRHVITLSNHRWSEGGEWYVDLNWYNATGCRR